MKNSQRSRLYRQIIAATLLMGGTFNLAAPVLAVGTSATTQISNTATATYQDPNDPNNQDATPGNDVNINATSNTVTVEVAEVAGITATPVGVKDVNEGSVSPNDTLEYNFRLTNVGNAPTNIFIPGKNKISATNFTITKVEADLNNSGTFEAGEEITNADDGLTTSTAIAADASIRVRVTGTVASAAQGAPVNVRIGNTGSNDNTSATQNQPDDGAEGATVGTDPVAALDEIRTVNTTPGTPVNGEREASAFYEVQISSQVNQTRAFATVLETATNNAGTPAANDNQITYRLDLRVESTSPNVSFTTGTLEGTEINLDSTTGTGAGPFTKQSRILVSDVIPTGTTLDTTLTPTAPTGWQVIYSTTPVAGSSDDALVANWFTSASVPSGVTRIGFIYTGTQAPGTTTESSSGFLFRVITSGMPDTGGDVVNMVQVFGETQNDTSNTIVYDEAGDQQPNNFNSDGSTSYPNGAGGFDPNTDNGKAILANSNQGTDNNNNNTGSGPDGEANVVTVPASPTQTASLLNGPSNQPGATGPSNLLNTDFTNKSATNTPSSTANFDPDVVTFNNTFKNSSSSKIDNFVLRPIAPSQADFVAGTTDQTDRNAGFGTNGLLLNGTTVTITYNSASAIYTWNGTAFTTTDTPIRISNIAAGESRNYSVSINLVGSYAQQLAFPVTIAAFVDEDSDSEFDRNSDNPATSSIDESTLEPFFNLTVDRVYTGYVKLVKESRILQGTGPEVQGNDGTFSTTAKKPAPGNIIEYRITYSNVSTPASAGGVGSAQLNASKLIITEDGTGTTPGQTANNWAKDADTNGTIDTSNVVGQALDSSGTGNATITFFNGTSGGTIASDQTGTTQATDVTKYVDTINTNLTPGEVRTFTFQRKVN